ncbi:Bro25 [Heliothis virescens ascovirus 3j]|uniref:Bro25 n=1 Tax=Heliothis virescens ascovirus 3j TaxID=1561067 RepID=A0A2Z5UZP0_9VIRU|nr:Bro25 [Heliothis virescens ascovirus 3j]
MKGVPNSKKQTSIMSLDELEFGGGVIEVLTAKLNDGIWYHAQPLVDALEYDDCNMAVDLFVAPRDRRESVLLDCYSVSNNAKSQVQVNALFTNRAGLHELTLNAASKFANDFRRYLASHFLPSHGLDPLRDFETWRRYSNADIQFKHRREGQVYVITTSKYEAENIYSIGCTIDVQHTLTNMNHCSPYDFYVKIVHSAKGYHALCETIKTSLAERRFNRNFYTLDDTCLNMILNMCKSWHDQQ